MLRRVGMIFAAAALLLALACGFAAAESEIDALLYEYAVVDGVLQDSYVITGVKDGFSGDLWIPAFIDGVSVSHIAERAFAEHSGITSVEIEVGVDSIGEYAFANCTALKKAVLPFEIYEIGDGVFSNCTALVDVAMPEDYNLVSAYMFYGCTALESITLPYADADGELPQISESAFEGCTALREVIFPYRQDTNWAQFSARCFANCINLEGLAMNSNMPIYCIGEEAFLNCVSLKELTLPSVADGEFKANSFEGCADLTLRLYEGSGFEKSALEYGVPYKRVSMFQSGNYSYIVDPESQTACIVEYIGEERALQIPARLDGYTVAEIGAYAFHHDLREVILPASIQKVSINAFQTCWDLMYYVYEGSAGHRHAMKTGLPFALIQGENEIRLAAESLYARVDDCFFIECTIPEAYAAQGFEYTSDDIDVAFIDYGGRITVQGVGETTLHYQSIANPNLIADCHIVVLDVPQISLPASIARVQAESFANDTSIQALSFLETRGAQIESGAFKNCAALKIVYLGNDVDLQAGSIDSDQAISVYIKNAEERAMVKSAGYNYAWQVDGWWE